jgi:hypothetical protein
MVKTGAAATLSQLDVGDEFGKQAVRGLVLIREYVVEFRNGDLARG